MGCRRCENCIRGLYTACLNYGNTRRGHRANGFTTNGGLAEYALNHVNTLYRIPDGVDYDEATVVMTSGSPLFGLQNAGVIDGNGTIEVPTTNNGGRIRPQGPEALLFTGILNNSFLIDVQSGILEVTGSTHNNADIDARDGAILRFRSTGLDNNSGAQLALTSGVVDIFGLVTNDFGGEIAVGGTAVAVFHDAVANSGTASVAQKSAVPIRMAAA